MKINIKKLCSIYVLIFVTTLTNAQLQLFPFTELNEDVLLGQSGLIPEFNSSDYNFIESGVYCSFDEDWPCGSTGPFLVPFPYVIDGPIDPRLFFAIIDYQLVLMPKNILSISNGFKPFTSNLNISNGFLKLPIDSGFAKLLGVDDKISNSFFKFNGFKKFDSLNQFTHINDLKSTTIDQVQSNIVPWISSQTLDLENQNNAFNYSQISFKSKLLNRFEMWERIEVILDGVIVETSIGSLVMMLDNPSTYIVSVIHIDDIKIIKNHSKNIISTTYGDEANIE